MKTIHSTLTRPFLSKTTKLIYKILTEETPLTLKGKRICYKNYLYSLTPVVFDHPEILGYFNPNYLEIGLNKLFLFSKDENTLLNVLRHEIGHFLTWLEHGLGAHCHGTEYRNTCTACGWGEEVYRAKLDLSNQLIASHSPTQVRQILAKVEKLMNLGQSTNPFEAEQATLKAQKLLEQYHLDHIAEFRADGNDEMVTERILQAKKSNAKLSAISNILRTFFVFPIISRGTEEVYLELFGKEADVEIAAYVGNVLNRQFDLLWDEAKRENGLKGMREKNSFFRGIAEGYLQQKRLEKRSEKLSQALMEVEKALAVGVSQAYPRLSHTYSRVYSSPRAHAAGKEKGKSLNIQTGVNQQIKNLLFHG